jgi:hypothetical protein
MYTMGFGFISNLVLLHASVELYKRITSLRSWQKTHVFCHPIKERHLSKIIKITQKLLTTKAPDFELQQEHL